MINSMSLANHLYLEHILKIINEMQLDQFFYLCNIVFKRGDLNLKESY